MAAGTQVRKIQVVVDTKGSPELKDIADKLGLLNKNTKQLSDGFGGLSAATGTFLGGLGPLPNHTQGSLSQLRMPGSLRKLL